MHNYSHTRTRTRTHTHTYAHAHTYAHTYTYARTCTRTHTFTGAPEFIEEPLYQVVTNGTDVTFRCSVLSSPEASHINWIHRNSVVQREDNNYNINTITHVGEEGGMITDSTLTIFNVTGFDSSFVECLTEYFADRVATVTASDRRETVLGVLGMQETLSISDVLDIIIQ